MEAKTAQLRVMRRQIIAEGAGSLRCPIHCGAEKCSHGGAVFWATPTRARLLVDAGAAELLNAGPSEIKPAGPLEKKSSAVDQAGPSTDSQSSKESVKAESPSASAAAPASAKDKPAPSKKRGRPKKSA